MIDKVLLIPLLVSFLITLLLMPFWIKKAKQIGLMWDDVNKLKSEKVAGSGGIIVILSFLVGTLLIIAYRVFILENTEHLVQIFSLLVTVLILAVIGLVDDLFGWQRGGLTMKSRIVMCFIAAIPLMAINAGRSIIDLPLLGPTDLGIIYPLILIPIGIIGTSTTFNFLAGFNALEAGQGVIILTALSLVALITGQPHIAVVTLCMVASLLAFLIFNYTPAKVFPGDVLTYPIGGMIGILAILGNFEKIAIFFFIPFIVEVLLKSRGKLKKASFGKPSKDGTLSLKYDKIYGTTHLFIFLLPKLNIRPTEKNVVLAIWTYNALIILLGFVLFLI